jgi:DNA repair exonuclease SbcCD ATPase subunit
MPPRRSRSRSKDDAASGGSRSGRRPEPSPVPYLADLRRRAAARLRELASELETLRREYADAAAQCERLAVPSPGGCPDVCAASGNSDQGACENQVARTDARKAELSAVRAEQLETELRDARTALTAERRKGMEAEERARQFEQRLQEAQERASQQKERADALAADSQQSRAEIEPVGPDGTHEQAAPSDAARGRLSGLEVELRDARAVNARLRSEMTGLLRFLDELNQILSGAVG